MPVALGVVCVVLWVVVGVGRGGDGDDPEPASDRDDARVADVLSDEELELIHGAEPDPACASEPTGVPADEDVVALDVVRVDDTCFDASTEYVAAGEVDARLAELDDDPAVVAASLAPPPVTPTQEDDRREDQWALDMLMPDEDSDEDSVELPWPAGDGVVVAVLDSGIDSRHDDLRDAVIARRHVPDETTLDPIPHGTLAAGIVAARRNGVGVVGVTPEASVLDVPVFMTGAEQNSDSWRVGLPWAVNHGADVVNMSFGAPRSDYDDSLYKVAVSVVEFARANDVVAVAGGGNCGNRDRMEDVRDCTERDRIDVPATLPGVVTVGALQKDHDLAGYSTRNDDIDLVAPGGGGRRDLIITTDVGGGYREFNGTSAAAPHVAAAAAALRAAVPSATGEAISQALIGTANPRGVSEGDRDDVGAGEGLVAIVAAIDRLRTTATPPDEAELADRTQAAFVLEGMLYAFDGARAHPVRPLDSGASVTWLEWSGDHSRLVGLAGSTLFSWSGPDSEPAEADYRVPCEACGPSLAYLDDISQPKGQGTSDVVVSLDFAGTGTEHVLTQYDAATLQEMGTTALSFPEGVSESRALVGEVGGRLVVQESGGTLDSQRLWLVDPASGEAQEGRDVTGFVLSRLAVNAADDRVAFVTGDSSCSSANHVLVLDGEDLGEIADVGTPSDALDPSGMFVDELFFNGDVLYATMTYRSSGGPGPCEAGSAGVWRLDGDTWEQVRSDPLANARPLEGRSGDEPTGWLTIETDGRGLLRPIQSDDTSLGDLGILEPELWSTPTRTEIDFDTGHPVGDGDGDEAGPPDQRTPSTTGGDKGGGGGGGAAPQTVEAAIARFEEYAHAFGEGDVATACAIGRPGVEAGGLGLTCEQAIPILREMFPPDYLAALRELDMDPSQVEQTAPDRVEIPPAYPYSTEPESDPTVIMEHDGTNWFMVP